MTGIQKDSPTVGDVHVEAPLGSQSKRGKNKLRNMQVKEISLVDKGCNPGAKSVLHKRKADTIISTAEIVKHGDLPMTPEEIAKKQAETEAALAQAQADLAKRDAELATTKDELEKAKKNPFPPKAGAAAADADEDDAVKKMLKEMPEEVKAHFSTLEKRAADSEKSAAEALQIAKGERDARELVTLEKRAAAEFGNLSGSDADKAKFLKAMNAMPEDVKAIGEAMLKAANAQAAEVFKELGASGQPAAAAGSKTEADAQLTKLAKAYQETHKVEFHKAYNAILDTPEGAKLYEQTQK